MHSLSFTLHMCFEINFFNANSSFFAFANKDVFWCKVQTQTEWVPDDPATTHCLGFGRQNLKISIARYI